MDEIPRELLLRFAEMTHWKDALVLVDDSDPVVLAGIADGINLPGVGSSSDSPYYVITARGMHVGNKTANAQYDDHYFDRESLDYFDTDLDSGLEFNFLDGTRLVLLTQDNLPQLTPLGMGSRARSDQARAIAAAFRCPFEQSPRRYS
jgi:hypothetical protein